jgi:hypothetical protein
MHRIIVCMAVLALSPAAYAQPASARLDAPGEAVLQPHGKPAAKSRPGRTLDMTRKPDLAENRPTARQGLSSEWIVKGRVTVDLIRR